MDNTMNFSYMTRICHNILKTCQAQNNRTGSTGFYEKLVEKSTEGQAVETEGAVETRTMSMAEYKLYLYDKIAALPIHPSNMQDSISVQITDEGFEAMKNDPEYEQWVLDSLKKNFQYPDPWSGVCGGKFTIFYFGATKEESRGESWRLGFRNGNGQKLFNEKAKDSFWERRRKRRKELLEQLEELEEKKAIARKMARSQYFMELSETKPVEGEPEESVNCNIDMLAMQIFSSFKANILLETFRGKKV